MLIICYQINQFNSTVPYNSGLNAITGRKESLPFSIKLCHSFGRHIEILQMKEYADTLFLQRYELAEIVSTFRAFVRALVAVCCALQNCSLISSYVSYIAL